MANFVNFENNAGEEIISPDNKINYNKIKGIPSNLVDAANHNHDDLYTSKNTIESEFGAIMDTVASLTKALTIRPLKTKGFLNGGYKSSYVYAQRVQRFNTVTETGVEIGQIGTVTSYYTPGGSSELKGYFFGSNTSSTSNKAENGNDRKGRHVDNIVYLTEVETYLGNIMSHDVRSTLYNIYSQSQLYVCDSSSNWSSISVVSDAVTVLSSAASQSTTRQGLSSEDFGYVVQNASSADKTSTKYTYLTGVSSTGTTQQIRQIPTGLSKDKDKGYWIDYGTANNWRINMVNNSVSNVVCFTEGFGESNSLGSEKVGFMMGGYDGKQHGKVQKMVWATEAASNVLGGSLAIPQSSAGMAES